MDDDFYAYANTSEHVDEGVDAEEVDLSFVEIADAGLSDAEELGGFRLFQTLRFNGLAEVDHQVRADLQVFGFFRGETQILENVSARARDFFFHGAPSFTSLFVHFVL